MEILVAILIIALIAAVAYAVINRRRDGASGLGRPRSSPLPRRDRAAAHGDPMAAAVAEHAEATDPHDAIVAEQRLQAQAREVAAGLNAEAHRSEHQRASDQLAAQPGSYAGEPQVVGDDAPAYANEPAGTSRYADPAPGPAHGDPRADEYVDPATGAGTDGRADPATDPRHDDRRR